MFPVLPVLPVVKPSVVSMGASRCCFRRWLFCGSMGYQLWRVWCLW